MKYLKRLWRELGENDLPMKPITAVVTVLTAINLLVLDIPTELQALMVTLNAVMILIAIGED